LLTISFTAIYNLTSATRILWKIYWPSRKKWRLS